MQSHPPLGKNVEREHSLSRRRIRKTGGREEWEGGTRMGNWGGEDDTFMTSAAAFPTSSHRACRSPRASVEIM